MRSRIVNRVAVLNSAQHKRPCCWVQLRHGQITVDEALAWVRWHVGPSGAISGADGSFAFGGGD